MDARPEHIPRKALTAAPWSGHGEEFPDAPFSDGEQSARPTPIAFVVPSVSEQVALDTIASVTTHALLDGVHR
jgi:hypothetical protein